MSKAKNFDNSQVPGKVIVAMVIMINSVIGGLAEWYDWLL